MGRSRNSASIKLFVNQYILGRYKSSSSIHVFNIVEYGIETFLSFLEYHGDVDLMFEVGKISSKHIRFDRKTLLFKKVDDRVFRRFIQL